MSFCSGLGQAFSAGHGLPKLRLFLLHVELNWLLIAPLIFEILKGFVPMTSPPTVIAASPQSLVNLHQTERKTGFKLIKPS